MLSRDCSAREAPIAVSTCLTSSGGGSSAGCSLTADRNRFVLSNGRTVSAGTVVTSAYHFVEGAAVPFDLQHRLALDREFEGLAVDHRLQCGVDGGHAFFAFHFSELDDENCIFRGQTDEHD